MILALHHHQLPPTLHATDPTPHVDWTAGTVQLLTQPTPWPPATQPRHAAVSSFGISGTNAHVILAEPPQRAPNQLPAGPPPAQPLTGPDTRPWLISARSVDGLRAQATRLTDWITTHPTPDPADLAWSLATTRPTFEHRAVITGSGARELVSGLAAVAAGKPAAGVVTGRAEEPGPVVFVFPGQGGQWAGMGRDLAACCPVFAQRLADCSLALSQYVDWDLGEVLAGAPGAPGLDRADVIQPVLWAVMVSLAAVWQAAGVQPDAVVGHSQGEIAAATVAGILPVEDAAKIVALRSQALEALAGTGAMISVAEPVGRVRDRIARWDHRLAIAVVNSPAATVVSGDPDAVQELAAECEQEEIRARILAVDYASHGPQVERIRDQVLTALSGIMPGPAQIPMMSAMSGQWVDGPELGASYWYESLRAPVQFAAAVNALGTSGHQLFIETSPHPVLTTAITQTLEDAARRSDTPPSAAVLVTGTLRRGDGGPARLLASLADVHVRGARVNWAAVLSAGQRVDLPTYAFQHQRYWPRPVPADVRSAGLGTIGHPLLGAAVELADDGGLVLTGLLSVGAQSWLADHAVAGSILVPGTALVEMAARAGDVAGCGQVTELVLETPLVLPTDGGVQVQVVAGEPDPDGQRSVQVWARSSDPGSDRRWTRHASGLLAPASAADALTGEFAVWPPPGAAPLDVSGLYGELAQRGYGYGPAFRGLRAAWQRGQDLFAEVALPADAATDAGAFGLHPALLDAALHAAALAGDETDGNGTGEVRLPFAWNGVTLHSPGASALRARLTLDARGNWSLAAADAAGRPVISVQSLALRPVSAAALEPARVGPPDALFSVDWISLPPVEEPVPSRCVIAGADRFGLRPGLAALTDVHEYAALTALADAIEAGEPAPDLVLAWAGDLAGPVPESRLRGGQPEPGGAAATARAAVGQALGLIQTWLAREQFGQSRLVILTRGAVAAGPGEGVSDLAGAAVWGLVRSAQTENPGRIALADLMTVAGPEADAEAAALVAALQTGEPEIAIRHGAAYGRRLIRPPAGLAPPADGQPWRLDVTEPGTLDGLELVACPQVSEPLGPGQVQVAVRAAGLNFRDVLIGLDMYPGDALMGGEIAGIVTAVGPDTVGLAVGDRVLGLAAGGFGPLAVTDARLLVRIPSGWSFASAASVAVAFSTAWYGLADLAGARAGQRLLVHAAAGGVGMAAVTIAQHLGLDVYGTASPAKHGVLAGMGLDAAHIASSRDARFEDQFLAATAGAGMDIVLNALAGELTDASLRLMPRGGAFIEMGKTDVRDAGQVAGQYPGVTYRAFETGEAGPQRLGEILGQVVDLLASEDLAMLPVRAWDVRRAPEAFRFMSQARHTGKMVMTIPVSARPDGTVLVTGGTGLLGGLVARHLATTGQAARMALTSRSGPSAAGAAGLAADLAAAGVPVQITACDAADRDALAGLLAGLAPAGPLTRVVHAAGVLDDGVTGSLTPDRVDAVMRPKADAAWNLHQLTQDADLDDFVLFSAAAATFGGAGQGNYAAANAFLDALAASRCRSGWPATSLAWGLWAEASGMTGHLGDSDRARMGRGGMIALTSEEGLALLDEAAGRDEALLVAARLDVAGLRARAARGQDVPPLVRELIPAGSGVSRPGDVAGAGPDAGDGLRRQMTGLPRADQAKLLLDLVRAHVAAVVGHSSAEDVEPDRSFRELGFDSLTAVELRNRLNAATGLQLPATLVFDYPTPATLGAYLREETADTEADGPPVMAEIDRLESVLSAFAGNGDERLRAITRLEALVQDLRSGGAGNSSDLREIDAATDEDIFDIIDKELGI
jgi:acyl transferase domain-containing protein/NADPH:quinone reductase-like Zn-dependent oxidoreductase/acyl carrier protein